MEMVNKVKAGGDPVATLHLPSGQRRDVMLTHDCLKDDEVLASFRKDDHNCLVQTYRQFKDFKNASRKLAKVALGLRN